MGISTRSLDYIGCAWIRLGWV